MISCKTPRLEAGFSQVLQGKSPPPPLRQKGVIMFGSDPFSFWIQSMLDVSEQCCKKRVFGASNNSHSYFPGLESSLEDKKNQLPYESQY
jgi:hypothetical protein